MPRVRGGVHEGCLETAAECPECGVDYAELLKEQADEDRAQRGRAGRENAKLAYRRKVGTGIFLTSSMFACFVWLRGASYAEATLVLVTLLLSAVGVLVGLAMIITGRSKG